MTPHLTVSRGGAGKMTKTPVFGVFFPLFWPSGPYTLKKALFGVKMGSKTPQNPPFCAPKNPIWGMVHQSVHLIFGPRYPVYKEYRVKYRHSGQPKPPFLGSFLTPILHYI